MFFLLLTRFTLLLPGWRGYLIACWALVWVANLYMSLFGRLRLDIRNERAEIGEEEQRLKPCSDAVVSLERRP